ncbi:MAG TPA: alanine racemase [Tepidisphaeraceae bacterium]|jgi:alanine racemase
MDAKSFAGEPRLLLSASALATNVRTLRRQLAPTVKIVAVLKADAYGHGAVAVAEMLTAVEAAQPFVKVDAFAVATADEAAALTAFGKPLTLLRPVENAFLGRQRDAIELAVLNGWTLTLSSAAAADDVARIALHRGGRARVQIMLDTGLTRCGASPAEFQRLLERTLHHASLDLVGLCTHFASGESAGDAYTGEQLRRFNRVVAEHPILDGVPKSVANSGAIFFAPRSHLDAVRPGIALYGIDPTGRPAVDRPLAPIARWTAPVQGVFDVAAGQSVGYGQTWIAPERRRIAIVPVGYADGYPRAASNRAVMMLAGKPCGVVGRVSMDMTAIDVTSVGDACVGDEVVVLDDNPLSPASIYQLSRIADTIPYELLCRIGPRVRRVCVGVESVVAADSAE